MLEFFSNPAVGLTGLFTTIAAIWFGTYQQRKKANIDESAQIFAEWRNLIDAHQAQIKGLEERFDAYRRAANEEIEGLRKRLKDVEDEFATFRKAAEQRAQERERTIAGLQRQLSQISQSTAVQLNRRAGVSHPDDADAVEKLDRAGDNSMAGK